VDRGCTRLTRRGDQGKQTAEERRDEANQPPRSQSICEQRSERSCEHRSERSCEHRSERSCEHRRERSCEHRSSPSSKLAQHTASPESAPPLQLGEHRVSSQVGEERGCACEEVGDESGSPWHTSHALPCHHVPLIPQLPSCIATEAGGGRGRRHASSRPSTNPHLHTSNGHLHTHSHATATGSRGAGRCVSAGVSSMSRCVSAQVSLPSAASPAVPSVCGGGKRRYGEAMRRRFYVDPKAKASRLLSALMRDKGWEQCASLPHPRRCDCSHCFKVTNSHSKSKSPF
jgi:hypothetical protein